MPKLRSDRWIQIVPGIRRQTLESGAQLMLMRVQLDAGSHLPEHHHPQEQITYVLSGRLRMVVAGAVHDLGPGDSVRMPGNAPHSVDVLEDALVIDTFSPPREDLLAQDQELAG